MVILDRPAGSLKVPNLALQILPYMYGQNRIRICDMKQFDPFSPKGHGSIVQEL